MASITLTTHVPGGLDPKSVSVRRIRKQVMSQSPTTGKQQVYGHPGKLWALDISLPVKSSSDAGEWISFLDAMNGVINTTTLDISSYTPGLTGNTAVSFRLAEPNDNWDINKAMHFGISFTLIEAI